jgi:protein phosphatase
VNPTEASGLNLEARQGITGLMHVVIPDLCLIALIGPSGCGKSSFARQHFQPTEILSSDFFRAMVGDDEANQAASADAFEVLHLVAEKRLKAGRLTVVDATNVQHTLRAQLVTVAKRHYCQPVAIVFQLPEALCQEHNRQRPGRIVPAAVVHEQWEQMRRSLPKLTAEGFRQIVTLSSAEEIDGLVIERQAPPGKLPNESGPFDIIGDVHGCCDELEELLAKLGYQEKRLEPADPCFGARFFAHPHGRRAIFVGDLVDRGPRIVESVRLVVTMVRAGQALCVPGNHDIKLVKKLRGKEVKIAHGLARTLAEIEALPAEIRAAFETRLADFFESLPSHYLLDRGKLAVAHAGVKSSMQGRVSNAVRDFCLYGATTGETDGFGMPVRLNWAADYSGRATVVYGHTPVPEPLELNNAIDIDTGCVFGGRLTALRYPEKELVSVPARQEYAPVGKPFVAPPAANPAEELVDVIDAAGNTIGTVTRREMRARRLPHRCVYILVFNSKGELFVHERTATKDVYPSHWDVAVGGVLTAGESFDAGARRELAEELGVTAEPELLFPFRHAEPATDVQAQVYRAVHDGPFRLQPEEIVRGKFVSLVRVDRQAAHVPFCPDGLAVLAEYRRIQGR